MRKCLSKWLRITFAISLLIIAIFINFKVRTIKIVGTSMCPTLSHGDRCIMYLTKNVNRGDIVAINMGNGICYCKRVIGIEGDELYIWKYDTLINGLFEPEAYVLFSDLHTQAMTVKVKQSELWVMGDNRHSSHDSRHFGPIKRSQIEGKLIWTFGRSL